MKKRRLFLGLFFVFGAILLLLSQTELLQGLPLNLWNVIITILMISIILDSVPKLHYGGIFFPLAVLCILYDEMLGITNISGITYFGAALLFSIGFGFVFPKKSHIFAHGGWSDDNEVCFDEVVDTDTNEYIKKEVNFGSCVKYINSDNFKSGHFLSPIIP